LPACVATGMPRSSSACSYRHSCAPVGAS